MGDRLLNLAFMGDTKKFIRFNGNLMVTFSCDFLLQAKLVLTSCLHSQELSFLLYPKPLT